MGRTIYLELTAGSKMANDLQVGGLFVIDKSLAMQEHCEIVVFNDGGQLELPAKAVYLDGNGGVGLELIGFDDSVRTKIGALLEAGGAAAAAGSDVGAEPVATEAAGSLATPSAEHDLDGGTAEAAAPVGEAAPEVALVDEGDDEETKSMHERLRGLSLAEQIKKAKGGTVTERTLLERIYGKNVWEALLRNPALTAPEVARIARMGSLPRPLLEIILGNGGWLQVPEIRRALLSNPRLGTDQILKLLRMMSKQELKLATMQTAYTMAVRSQAKTLLKQEGG